MVNRLLILSVYSPGDVYDKMLEQSNKYINKCKTTEWYKDNICFYFITFREDLEEEFIVDKNRNLLIMRGNENILPGILHKTIRALEIVNNTLKWKYEFILRTSVATNVNIYSLFTHLQSMVPNKNYYMGNIVMLQHYDPHYGIVDKKYWGSFYAGGNFVIFNHHLGEMMVKLKNEFDYTIVDDLALGVFIKNIHQLLEPVEIINLNLLTSPRGEWDANKMVIFNNCHKHNRQIDLDNHLLNYNTLTNTLKMEK